MSDSQENICNEIAKAIGMPLSQALADKIAGLLQAQSKLISQLSGRLSHLQAELATQKKKLVKANIRAFGPSADTLPKVGAPNQAELQCDEAPEARLSQKEVLPAQASKDEKRNPPFRGGRGQKKWGPGTEFREVLHQTSDGMCPCGCGGTIFDYDIDYVYETIPAQYHVAVHKYPKYRCRVKDQIIGTKFEPKILPRTAVSASFMAHALNQRYAFFLPWYRQVEMMRQQGLELNRSTVCRWASRIAHRFLKSIYNAAKESMLNESVRVFMDETTVNELDPGAGKVRKSQMFAIHRDESSIGGNLPPCSVYFYRRTRNMEHVHTLLAEKSLIVHHDGHAIYGQLG